MMLSRYDEKNVTFCEFRGAVRLRCNVFFCFFFFNLWCVSVNDSTEDEIDNQSPALANLHLVKISQINHCLFPVLMLKDTHDRD